mgnify:FL=1
MEKEEILLENFKDFKENLIDFNRTLIFIYDIFLQKKEEFEEKSGEIVSVDNCKYTESNNEELTELSSKTEECLKENAFDNYYDIYREFTQKLEFMEQDLSLINSCFKVKIDKEILIYNYAKLNLMKSEIKLMKDNVDELINRVEKLKKK